MSKTWCVPLLLALAAAEPASTDEARQLLDRAVRAAGGEAKLTRFATFHRTGKGKFHGAGQPVEFTAEWLVRLPRQLRQTVRSETAGMTFELVKVIDGDHGWLKVNNTVEELSKEALAEEQEQLYAAWVATLLPLKDKEFTLARLGGESKVRDRPAVAVKVTRKDHRDVVLYFDKEKGWLLKSETVVRPDSRNEPVVQEVYYDNYQAEDGVSWPRRTVIRRAGRLFVEMEVTGYKPVEKLDEKAFGKP